MTRWVWALLAAVVVVALAAFFWPTSNRTTVPSVAQAPAPGSAAKEPTPAPAPASPAQTPAPAPASTAQTKASASSPAEPAQATAPASVAPAPALAPAVQAPAPASAESTSAPASTPSPPAQTQAAPAPTESTSAPASTPSPPAQTQAASAPTEPTPAPARAASETSEQPNDAASRANDTATTELASLQSGFGAKDLIAALNDSVVNFATGSAEVPSSMAAFLQKAADDLKQLPTGDVLEIAGYTDNTGDPAANIALSQRRADAVRDALINAGADPPMLVAKGYGSADPIASNDTPEGRLRNRRIEYHEVKTPMPSTPIASNMAGGFDPRLIGAWAPSASDCKEIFETQGENLTFRQPVNTFTSAFIVRERDIRGVNGSCRIGQSSSADGYLRMKLDCTAGIGFLPVDARIKVISDNEISYGDASNDPSIDATYERCSP